MKAIDGVSCHPPVRVDQNDVPVEKNQDSSSTSSSSSPSSKPSINWFNWGKKKTKKPPTDRLYDGSIVIADRGECMFEEKVIQAELAGAEGIIIVNNEVSFILNLFIFIIHNSFFFLFIFLLKPNLFLMSGIKSLEQRKLEISNGNIEFLFICLFICLFI